MVIPNSVEHTSSFWCLSKGGSVRSDEQAGLKGRCAEGVGEECQQRHNECKAEHVNADDESDVEEAFVHKFFNVVASDRRERSNLHL